MTVIRGFIVEQVLRSCARSTRNLRQATFQRGKCQPSELDRRAPLRMAELKGKVVMVEFWTFGCYNCRNVKPYVKQWHQNYADKGFVVIGVHSPEFSYEHDFAKVKQYIQEHDIRFPIPIDNDFSTWNRYGNRYWPAMYLIDKQGVIRHVRIGEGGYQETERLIQSLLAETF